MTTVKQKPQEKKANKLIRIIGGIAVTAAIAILIYLGGGLGSSTTALAGPAPAGLNCDENKAYMQTAVDKYKENIGQFPTDLNQLLEPVDGRPCAEKLLGCPTDGPYSINNGIVE